MRSQIHAKGKKMLLQDPALFLKESPVVDFSHPEVAAVAKKLGTGTQDRLFIAKRCFEYVRDEIRHSGDFRDELTTCSASEVLRHRTGWCYAKSHLLAALLRANDIPAGFCYQRLKCFEYGVETFCLHGLNALYLEGFGWYRVDARGNKEGVDARFSPPVEVLAFRPEDGEEDLPGIFDEPLGVVLEALRNNKNYEAIVKNFPDIADTTKQERV